MRRSLSLGLVMALLGGCALFPHEHYVMYFQPQSAELDDQARQVIADLAHKAIGRPGEVVTVSGFADPEGTVFDNKNLSARRAGVVAATLVADGVDAARIRRHAVGGVDYAMDSVESRRVEVTVGPP